MLSVVSVLCHCIQLVYCREALHVCHCAHGTLKAIWISGPELQLLLICLSFVCSVPFLCPQSVAQDASGATTSGSSVTDDITSAVDMDALMPYLQQGAGTGVQSSDSPRAPVSVGETLSNLDGAGTGLNLSVLVLCQ